MKEITKDNIIGAIMALLIISPIIGFFIYVPYKMRQDTVEMNERIKDNIVLSKPFNDVVIVSSSFIRGAEDWYFVSIQVTTDEHSGSPQWIYDFRYNDNTDTLYYDGGISGIGVENH